MANSAVMVSNPLYRTGSPQRNRVQSRRQRGRSSPLISRSSQPGEAMATTKREIIPNQVFVGLPWRNVRPKYEKVIDQMSKKYPLYFTIVRRDDGQDAVSLFEVIK